MIKNNNFKKFYFKNKVDFSRFRWSLDEIDDLKVIEGIIKEFKPNIYFSWEEAMKKILTSKKKLSYNEYLKRNEGSTMSKTSKLWRRAKKLIPGGNMLLSKRPELFHPELWPAYYKKAKNCTIWDLDGKKYSDVSLMGVGSNILGYANNEVDKAVKSNSLIVILAL